VVQLNIQISHGNAATDLRLGIIWSTSLGNPGDYLHKPYTVYLRETESLGYIVAADSVSIQFYVVGFEKACILKQNGWWPFKVIQRDPRSLISLQIERAYATSY